MLSSLNSLLKPTLFIVQSRTSTGKGKQQSKGSSNSNGGQDTAGMNQAQQQKVLHQFSEGIVFNVIVCTCDASSPNVLPPKNAAANDVTDEKCTLK